jgi:hypothetical protein
MQPFLRLTEPEPGSTVCEETGHPIAGYVQAVGNEVDVEAHKYGGIIAARSMIRKMVDVAIGRRGS